VLEGPSTLRANVISSQLAHHAPYGGVVPELAARAHLENLPAILDAALAQAEVRLEEIHQIGVTRGPGLVGALLTGAGFAKGLAWGLDVPLVAVDHLEAHIFANLLEHPDLQPPFLALVISGGHTLLVRVEAWGSYRRIGGTRDDAAGEAFDKVAKLLELGYPGGPRIEQLAQEGDPSAVPFPRPMWNDPSYDFSFSGLKTAVAVELRRREKSLSAREVADVCASFQAAVVDSLARKTFQAVDEESVSVVILAGGVSRNESLRRTFELEAGRRGLALVYPSPELCTDNAAMIARTAYFYFTRKIVSPLDFSVVPTAGFLGGIASGTFLASP
jgi:N6-L-threonylcarbamoyladenine synthase